MFRPFRAPIARPGRVSIYVGSFLGKVLTFALLPEVQVEYAVYHEPRLRLDQNRRQHSRIHDHAPLKKEMQGPLRTIIVIPPNRPRLNLRPHQRLQRSPNRRFLAMPTLTNPSRIHVFRHVVRIYIRHEPAE
jgi:hypothetical protein